MKKCASTEKERRKKEDREKDSKATEREIFLPNGYRTDFFATKRRETPLPDRKKKGNNGSVEP